MSAELLRQGVVDKIAINPFVLTGLLYATKDNGYGTLIRDLSSPPEEKTYSNPVRIGTTKKPIKKTLDADTPIVYENVYFMLSDWETVVDEKLEFLYFGVSLRVEKTRPLVKFDEVFGYEYELREVGVEYGT